MALNRLISLGVGVAVAGAVVKSTLYNGKAGRRGFERTLITPNTCVVWV